MFQEKLIFFPQPLSGEEADTIKIVSACREYRDQDPDNVVIRGMVREEFKAPRPSLIIYFGGMPRNSHTSFMKQRSLTAGPWRLSTTGDMD
jgi:hypothetical protein